MPTPPTYTSAFRVVGGLAEGVTLGQPSWGYFRSAPIGVSSQVNYASGTSSYDYVDTAYAGISAMTSTLYRTWFPFTLQAMFNGSASGDFVVRDWIFGDPPDQDTPFVAEEDFAGGVVGATVTAFDGSGYSTFTITSESGNHNFVPQSTVHSSPITAITLP